MIEIKIDNKNGTRMAFAAFIPATMIINEAPIASHFNVHA